MALMSIFFTDIYQCSRENGSRFIIMERAALLEVKL